MRILIFGASGMVGQGVVRECLRDENVSEVLCVGRSALPEQHAKLRQIIHGDLFDLAAKEDDLRGFDACLFCLGVSSFRMKEELYRHITQQLTLSIAERLLPLNPSMVFVYVSGEGTDPHGKAMWARVKGETEQALLGMPFRATYMFRPGLILPLHGIRSKSKIYQLFYSLFRPIGWLLRLNLRLATTTEAVGQAMLQVVKHLPSKHILHTAEINRLASYGSP